LWSINWRSVIRMLPVSVNIMCTQSVSFITFSASNHFERMPGPVGTSHHSQADQLHTGTKDSTFHRFA
jgi:hypothetical protein